ncbi:hypothetical protein H7K45_20795 [Mycobacterium yunnanensis]|uniref:Uncharacterized protein n=1 Tax=Mycobacterium yunnanensis TaxID=368477 RepID=A0A9X2Z3K0_9MYCO|nr:hypothetical protein [Mycobacterium yunnanensis]MCV7422995.1 hypothetical protein [Mycobacterium yunnanensis]
MTDTRSPEWDRLGYFADNMPNDDEIEEARELIAKARELMEKAERQTAAARALFAPRTTTPAKWRPPIQRYPSRGPSDRK